GYASFYEPGAETAPRWLGDGGAACLTPLDVDLTRRVRIVGAPGHLHLSSCHGQRPILGRVCGQFVEGHGQGHGGVGAELDRWALKAEPLSTAVRGDMRRERLLQHVAELRPLPRHA